MRGLSSFALLLGRLGLTALLLHGCLTRGLNAVGFLDAALLFIGGALTLYLFALTCGLLGAGGGFGLAGVVHGCAAGVGAGLFAGGFLLAAAVFGGGGLTLLLRGGGSSPLGFYLIFLFGQSSALGFGLVLTFYQSGALSVGLFAGLSGAGLLQLAALVFHGFDAAAFGIRGGLIGGGFGGFYSIALPGGGLL